ncbi:MAG: hypothetical protein WD358_06900 [Nitriliruptoraceae bacterium]
MPDGAVIQRPQGANVGPGAGTSDRRTWMPLDALAALDVTIKDLGDGAIGLCPDDDRCVVVPQHALASGRPADTTEEPATDGPAGAVDLTDLAGDLDLVVADDGHHAAVRRSVSGGSAVRLHAGDAFDLALPDLNGVEGSVVTGDGRVAVFAWASW